MEIGSRPITKDLKVDIFKQAYRLMVRCILGERQLAVCVVHNIDSMWLVVLDKVTKVRFLLSLFKYVYFCRDYVIMTL